MREGIRTPKLRAPPLSGQPNEMRFNKNGRGNTEAHAHYANYFVSRVPATGPVVLCLLSWQWEKRTGPGRLGLGLGARARGLGLGLGARLGRLGLG